MSLRVTQQFGSSDPMCKQAKGILTLRFRNEIKMLNYFQESLSSKSAKPQAPETNWHSESNLP